MPTQHSTNLDDELYLIIGKTVRWWSMIEFTVDSSIRDLLNRPDTEHLSTSLKISLPNRIKLLKRLFTQTIADADNRQTFTMLMDHITGRQHIRELLVHGFMTPDSKRPDTHVYLSRIHWETPTRRDPVYKSREELHKNENIMGTLAMALFMATAGCHELTWRPYFDKDLLQILSP